MMTESYQALVVEKTPDKKYTYSICSRVIADLPAEEVLVRVHYSTINFKDGMSCQGNPAVTRRFPHTPGIDGAGVVEQSTVESVRPGDKVVVVAQPMGMLSPGGFGQYIRVPAKWLMKVPADEDLKTAMAFGTAGITAALAIDELVRHFGEVKGLPMVVSGATGGVGVISVALLAALGCRVTAISGKAEADRFLKDLGAHEVLTRAEVEKAPAQNLLKCRWHGGVDVAGGAMLANLLKQISDFGCLTAMGMVADTALNTTVLPFILRGVRLIGINAENTDTSRRNEAWRWLQTALPDSAPQSLFHVISLENLPAALDAFLAGRQTGRIVVDLR